MNADRITWIVGGVALLVVIVDAFLQPDRFAFAWLAAVTIWFRWPLGCLALVLVYALTGGNWGTPIRPWLLAGVATLPLLLLAIFPVVLLLPQLYPWARSGAELQNGFYLNLPFAAVRWTLYLIVWFGIGGLTIWRIHANASLHLLAPPSLILLGLTANFAAIDALMSLDPHFNSSDFGMTFAAESGLFALSISIFATALTSTFGQSERNDLGRLLQSLLILWAYLDFMQVLIIWQSNLPHEAAWYVARTTGLWGVAAAVIVLAHFLLPFLILLVPPLRRSRGGLLAVSGLLIGMSIVRGWWLVLPAQGSAVDWIDIAAVIAFGGLSVGLARRGPGLHLHLTHA
jgi:hypothetical protein